MLWSRSAAPEGPSPTIASNSPRSPSRRCETVLRQRVTDETTFSFEGVGFVVQGSARVDPASDVVLVAEVSVDGQPPEVVELPTNHARRRYAPFWRYGLSPGKHTVRVKMRPLPPGATLYLERVIVYGPEPKRPPV